MNAVAKECIALGPSALSAPSDSPTESTPETIIFRGRELQVLGFQVTNRTSGFYLDTIDIGPAPAPPLPDCNPAKFDPKIGYRLPSEIADGLAAGEIKYVRPPAARSAASAGTLVPSDRRFFLELAGLLVGAAAVMLTAVHMLFPTEVAAFKAKHFPGRAAAPTASVQYQVIWRTNTIITTRSSPTLTEAALQARLDNTLRANSELLAWRETMLDFMGTEPIGVEVSFGSGTNIAAWRRIR